MFTYHINFVLCLYFVFRPNKYNSVCRTRSDFLWAPANTFLCKFSYKTIIVKRGEISDSFLAKTTCVIGKVIKNYIQHIIMITLIFDVFVDL